MSHPSSRRPPVALIWTILSLATSLALAGIAWHLFRSAFLAVAVFFAGVVMSLFAFAICAEGAKDGAPPEKFD